MAEADGQRFVAAPEADGQKLVAAATWADG